MPQFFEINYTGLILIYLVVTNGARNNGHFREKPTIL